MESQQRFIVKSLPQSNIGASVPSSSFNDEPSMAEEEAADRKRRTALATFAAASGSEVVAVTFANIVKTTTPTEQEILAYYKVNILNAKEVRSDELVAKIVAMVEAQIPPQLEAEEKRQALEKAVLVKLSSASECLNLKLRPLLKAYLNRKEEKEMDELFYNMVVPQMTRQEKARIYGIMFSRILDFEHVSFATGNPRALGNLAPVDAWFLTFFVFVTCRRVRGDNLLQLGCSGVSTCGKSTILEAVIKRTSHELLTSGSSSGGDAGVGRFEIGKKNAIFLHDISIGKMFGVDFERIKAISRAETTVAKIHSHVTVLPPLHLFYTSNQRLQDHHVPTPNLFAAAASGNKKMTLSRQMTNRLMGSQVADSVGALRKHVICKEDLAAIKNRFLEMLIVKKPYQEEAHLNLSETFDRWDFIAGTFDRALSVLEKYSPSDFPSMHLYGYVIGALKKNSLYYEEVLTGAVDGEEAKTAEAFAKSVSINGDDDDDDVDFFDGDERATTTPAVAPANDDNDDDEDDRCQLHYLRILNLANKYNVH
jgi:hypothetical protein